MSINSLVRTMENLKNNIFSEAIINIDNEPADSIYSWYMYQKFIGYFEKKFEDWQAYKYGIINKDGKIIRKPRNTQEKSSLNAIANLVRKLKMNMLKHSSDSVIRIISYYLKYGFRTQDLSLSEYNDHEIKFLKRFDENVGIKSLLRNVVTEKKTDIVVNGDVNFVDLFKSEGVSLIKNLVGDVSLSFNMNALNNFILKNFFRKPDQHSLVASEFVDFYTTEPTKIGSVRYVRINFPTHIVISGIDHGKIGKITLSDVRGAEGIHNIDMYENIYKGNFKLISAFLSDGLIKFVDNAGMNCAVNIDISTNAIRIYYRKQPDISVLKAKFENGSMMVDSIDESMSDSIISAVSKYYDIEALKEDTSAGDSLSGYMPPMGRLNKRKPTIGVDDDDDEILKEQVQKMHPFISDVVKNSTNEILDRVQKIYDSWQNGPDVDPQIKYNGICGEIVDTIIESILDTVPDLHDKYDVEFRIGSDSKKRHHYVKAHVDDEIYRIDIPFELYERPIKGSTGYRWQKIQNVKFKPSDLTISKLAGAKDA